MSVHSLHSETSPQSTWRILRDTNNPHSVSVFWFCLHVTPQWWLGLPLQNLFPSTSLPASRLKIDRSLMMETQTGHYKFSCLPTLNAETVFWGPNLKISPISSSPFWCRTAWEVGDANPKSLGGIVCSSESWKLRQGAAGAPARSTLAHSPVLPLGSFDGKIPHTVGGYFFSAKQTYQIQPVSQVFEDWVKYFITSDRWYKAFKKSPE